MGLLVAGARISCISLNYGWRVNFAVLAAIGAVWCVLWLLLGREGTLDSLRAGQSPADSHRIPYRRLLTDSSVLGNYVCHFAANWSLALTLAWVPSYLEIGLGLDPLKTGHMFVLFVVVTTPLILFMAWLSQRLLSSGKH